MFEAFERTGVGLHTGVRTTARVAPSQAGSGIVFRRGGVSIPGVPASIRDGAGWATVLEADGVQVTTVEHLLAALAAFGQRDVCVEMDGPEIPILDGSALAWTEALVEAGAKPGPCFVAVESPVCVELGESRARLEPLGSEEEPSIRLRLHFDDMAALCGERTFFPRRDDFVEALAPARTFVRESDLETVFAAGLARGGGLHNALVIGERGAVNPEGMRFPDEPVRHKLIDALGDLFMLGGLPWARIDLERPGHALLAAFTRKVAPHCQILKG